MLFGVDLPLLKVTFLFITFLTVFLGILVAKFERILPVFIVKVYKYGKFEVQDNGVVNIKVPKRWFKHFYVLAVILSTGSLVLLTGIYFKLFKHVPSKLLDFLYFWGITGKPSGNPTTTYLATILMTIQCYKRFYETHMVSIFSDGKMDINHYLIGHFHYVGVFAAILGEAPGIVSRLSSTDAAAPFKLAYLTWPQICAAVVFLSACATQLQVAKHMASFRINKKGVKITDKHVMPQGGLFEWVSCPHMLSEILMYVSTYVILPENTIWPYIVCWVVCNQISVALMTHSWYKKEFQQYPKNRKAIIPYIL